MKPSVNKSIREIASLVNEKDASLKDLFTDGFIVNYLYRFHPMWALSSICTMLAPFYVAYVPFVNFLVRGEHLQKRTALKYLTVVPVIIFIIIFADFFFVTQGVLAPICI
jgi:hypothetical protein